MNQMMSVGSVIVLAGFAFVLLVVLYKNFKYHRIKPKPYDPEEDYDAYQLQANSLQEDMPPTLPEPRFSIAPPPAEKSPVPIWAVTKPFDKKVPTIIEVVAPSPSYIFKESIGESMVKKSVATRKTINNPKKTETGLKEFPKKRESNPFSTDSQPPSSDRSDSSKSSDSFKSLEDTVSSIFDSFSGSSDGGFSGGESGGGGANSDF